MRYLATLLLASAVALPARAAPPKLVVPGKADVGDVIAAKLDGPALATDWRVTDATGKPVNVIVLPDGSLVFGSGAKARKIVVRAAVAYKEAEAVKAALLDSTIQVGDDQPEPQPQPTPAPDPALPDGTFGLAKFVKDAAVGEGKGLALLADSFKAVRTQVAAGRYKKLEDALADTAAQNKAALQKAMISADQYGPLFTKLQDRLYSLYADKRLNTMADLATAYEEIAAGLEAASKGGK